MSVTSYEKNINIDDKIFIEDINHILKYIDNLLEIKDENILNYITGVIFNNISSYKTSDILKLIEILIINKKYTNITIDWILQYIIRNKCYNLLQKITIDNKLSNINCNSLLTIIIYANDYSYLDNENYDSFSYFVNNILKMPDAIKFEYFIYETLKSENRSKFLNDLLAIKDNINYNYNKNIINRAIMEKNYILLQRFVHNFKFNIYDILSGLSGAFLTQTYTIHEIVTNIYDGIISKEDMILIFKNLDIKLIKNIATLSLEYFNTILMEQFTENLYVDYDQQKIYGLIDLYVDIFVNKNDIFINENDIFVNKNDNINIIKPVIIKYKMFKYYLLIDFYDIEYLEYKIRTSDTIDYVMIKNYPITLTKENFKILLSTSDRKLRSILINKIENKNDLIEFYNQIAPFINKDESCFWLEWIHTYEKSKQTEIN